MTLVVGVGAGWMDEEFQAVGAPPFAERGKVTDEYLRGFKTLWTQDDPPFEARHIRFADISFLPKPVHKPHPPLWIGGESRAARRRVVALGDAWYPIGLRQPAARRRRREAAPAPHDTWAKAGRARATISSEAVRLIRK